MMRQYTAIANAASAYQSPQATASQAAVALYPFQFPPVITNYPLFWIQISYRLKCLPQLLNNVYGYQIPRVLLNHLQ